LALVILFEICPSLELIVPTATRAASFDYFRNRLIDANNIDFKTSHWRQNWGISWNGRQMHRLYEERQRCRDWWAHCWTYS